MKRRLLILVMTLLTITACALPGVVHTPVVEPPTVSGPIIQSTAVSGSNTQVPLATPVINYGQVARGHIVALTNIGQRVASTDAEQQAAEYISGVFQQYGYAPETQPFTATDDYGDQVDSANVVAVKSGRSTQEIIVGAHYDSVSDAGLGADDNASGVAVMLEVAGLLKDKSTPYTIRFIAFGAEEPGLLGSYAYVDKMSQADLENTVAMINLDSVTAGDIAYVYGDEGQATLRDWTLSWAFGNGFDLQTIHNVDLNEDGGGTSDYDAFQQAGIPFIYFEATNWNLGDKDGYTQVDPQYGDQGAIWHTKYDTLAYLDATFPGRVDQHLTLFTATLYNILTQFEDPAR